MFQRLESSWKLVKASASVLQSDKELIIFPIISTIGVLIVMLTFAVPLFFAGILDSMTQNGLGVFHYLILFLFYVVQYTVIIFANSALVGAATIRLKGGDPTAGDGFRIALQHLGNILGYALIAATVGTILRAISERGSLGRFIASLVGMAWNLIVFLAVPVLVVEGIGPMQAIKRSGELLKKTWGEQLVGNLGIGLIFGLAIMVVIFAGIPLIIFAVTTQNIAFIIGSVVFVVLAIALLGIIQSTLNGIYAAAVYQYAVSGDAGTFFDPELVKNAFKAQEQKKLSGF